MTDIMTTFEKEKIEKLVSNKRIPAFRSGDTMKVTLKIIEGERSRLQIFEGVCIARKNNGINSNFTIRKISHGEGVEKVFPLFGPLISKIEIVRKGDVRRAKLYYLRNRKGKSARIIDSNRGEEEDQYFSVEIQKPVVENKVQHESTEKENQNTQNKSEIKNKKIEEAKPEIENKMTEDTSNKPSEELIVDKKSQAEKNTDSTISEVNNTKDESKS